MDSLSGLHCMVESATRCHMNKVIEKIEKTTNLCELRNSSCCNDADMQGAELRAVCTVLTSQHFSSRVFNCATLVFL